MSRFIIACGGTGGHLAPGIALAEWLIEEGHNPLLLISNKQIDAKITEKYPDLEFGVIPGAPLAMGAAGMLHFGIQQMRGLWFSWRLLRKERPAAIIGFGGFTTASIIVAGWLRGTPVAMHEANRVVGRAVRTLASFANRIYLPRGVKLPAAGIEKVRHCGLPVRREIQRLPRAAAALRFGLDPNLPTVVVMGGSQGAQALNEWSNQHADYFAKKGVQILAVTGPSKGEKSSSHRPGPEGREVAQVQIPFCDEMASLFSSADLVVSRSGAGTLAELVRCRVPAVLIPYPFAADDHQAANAAEFAHRGGGILIPEPELTKLAGEVEEMVLNTNRLSSMRAQLAEIERSEALELMFADLEVLAGVRAPTGIFAP